MIASVAVIGEAVIDLVPGEGAGTFVARPGGSPFNVAVGLARLGCSVALLARLADNAFGRVLRAQATAEGIDLTHAPHAVEPTTLAVVSLDDHARASYDFYMQGTADWQWTAAELAALPSIAAVVHFGSMGSWLPPGDAVILAAIARSSGALVSYDPNVRPSLLGSPAAATPIIEAGVAVAQVVKASRDDIDWLYPTLDVAAVAARWIGLGAALVVITDGADGAQAFTASGMNMSRPGRQVSVVDTVGAGDAFTAGLLARLVRHAVITPGAVANISAPLLEAVVDDAILVAALTCERAGADPPRLQEGDFPR